jgi:hypothetical protein
MSKKKPNNLPSPTSIVSGGSATSSGFMADNATTAAVWKGGFVTDNFRTYYLDENMVKHYK